jgi:hypothetical protein
MAAAKAVLAGYPVTVFDLGGLGFGEPLPTERGDLKKQSFIPCVFKPRAIRRALEITKEPYLIWLDADAFLQDKIDEIFTDDYDVGVTERDPREVKKYANNPKVGSINSGVIFFRRSRRLLDFVNRWQLRAIAHNLEQQGLNELVNTGLPGIRIKKFPCRIYNNYYFDSQNKHPVKVIHYKGGRQRRIDAGLQGSAKPAP